MAKHAIFLSGPVGAGKTTLGRALAGRMSGGFLDGDDLAEPGRPWYCSILRTSRAVVQAGAALLQDRDVVVIAYPLGCTNWIYYRRKFSELGVRPIFVSLRASYSAIVGDGRGRAFREDEHARIQVMIAEGYGERPFSDVVVDTDRAGFAETLEALEREVSKRLEA